MAGRWIDVPREVKAAVQSELACWTFLLPPWCQELRIRWDPELEATAEVTVHVPNRWATIRIGPPYLEQPQDERLVVILHEILHIALHPYTTATTAAMRHLAGEDRQELLAMGEDFVEQALEGVVEDLARSVHRHGRED